MVRSQSHWSQLWKSPAMNNPSRAMHFRLTLYRSFCLSTESETRMEDGQEKYSNSDNLGNAGSLEARARWLAWCSNPSESESESENSPSHVWPLSLTSSSSSSWISHRDSNRNSNSQNLLSLSPHEDHGMKSCKCASCFSIFSHVWRFTHLPFHEALCLEVAQWKVCWGHAAALTNFPRSLTCSWQEDKNWPYLWLCC